MALKDDILELEYGFWLGGADYYRANLDETCVVVFEEMAGTFGKEEVAQMTSAQRWRDVQIVDKALSHPTQEVAVLTYDVEGHRGGGETFRARVSSLYVRRGGAWKMAFHQQTPLART
jgi:hypothetical protein